MKAYKTEPEVMILTIQADTATQTQNRSINKT